MGQAAPKFVINVQHYPLYIAVLFGTKQLVVSFCRQTESTHEQIPEPKQIDITEAQVQHIIGLMQQCTIFDAPASPNAQEYQARNSQPNFLLAMDKENDKHVVIYAHEIPSGFEDVKELIEYIKSLVPPELFPAPLVFEKF